MGLENHDEINLVSRSARAGGRRNGHFRAADWQPRGPAEGRTRQGVKSGELTEKEAAQIRGRQRNLDQKAKQDKADGGGLTAAERAWIEARQDNQPRFGETKA